MRLTLVTVGALLVGGLTACGIASHLAPDPQGALLLGMVGGLSIVTILGWGRA